MRIGSLFSGAGGLDLAVEHVFNATTAWHCEIDPAASKVLAMRWPDVPNYHDITQFDWDRIAEVGSVEPVDILCGGWPCQPFSLAGKRKGAADERALWPYVANTIRMVRPRIVVLENVSAVLGPEFSRVANDLASLGYEFAWTCVRAGDVGAPHRRERIFILAYASSAAIWPQPLTESGSGDQALTRRHFTATTAAESQRRSGGQQSQSQLVGDGQEPTHGGTRGRVGVAPHTARVGRDEGRPEPAGQQRGSDAALSGDGSVDLLPTPEAKNSHAGPDYARMNREGSGGHDLVTALTLLSTPSSADGQGGHLNRSGDRKGELLLPGQAREMESNWGKYAAAIHRWESLTRPAPAPTEPNKNGNPRLSAAFAEWMMGWPEGWVTYIDISRNDQLRIIGNGVVPQQAVAALRWLLKVCAVAA